jgi:tRNA threonylcarbamoyl adenosine modification protein (Sua5/YciO/YrdC/YwlC family)
MTPDQELLRALEMGKVCLHPAGTMPGLTCAIENPKAMQELLAFKLRAPGKPFIGLISNLDQAFKFWKPVSRSWRLALESIWPAHLTVIHGAQPVSFPLGENRSLALRMPDFSVSDQWMNEVLRSLDVPFPSTSVNISGEPPAESWEEAVLFAKQYDIFVPHVPIDPVFSGTPSTVIQICDDRSYRLVRTGGFDPSKLKTFDIDEIFKT